MDSYPLGTQNRPRSGRQAKGQAESQAGNIQCGFGGQEGEADIGVKSLSPASKYQPPPKGREGGQHLRRPRTGLLNPVQPRALLKLQGEEPPPPTIPTGGTQIKWGRGQQGVTL